MASLDPTRLLLLAATLISIGAVGFHEIPGLIADDADGSRLVNAVYCSVMTLTTVGFGDVCPTPDCSHYGRFFIVALSFCGLGMFSGPIMDYAASWNQQVPGGLLGITVTTLGLGVAIFTTLEGMEHWEAIYFTVITGTTIGFGEISPKTDEGKLAAAIFAILVINVVAALLEPAREFLSRLCTPPPPSTATTTQAAAAPKEDSKTKEEPKAAEKEKAEEKPKEQDPKEKADQKKKQ